MILIGINEMRMEVEGSEIKNVEKYKYLGGLFGREGGSALEISSRIDQYGRTVRALYPIIRDRWMGGEVKRTIFESILTPILLYGAETWSMTSKEESRIQTAEMNVLRAISGKTRRDRVRNETIRERVGVKPILNKIDVSRLRWWGHVERMPEERVARRRWEWRPEDVRLRGRPRKRWRESVEDTLRRNRMPPMRQLVEERVFEDRGRWKRMLLPLTGS